MTDAPQSPPPGSGAAPGPAQTGPLTIHGQYIKDLSFENPRAPQSLIEQIEYKSPRPTPAGSVQGGSGLPSSAGSGSSKASSNDRKYWRDKLSMLTSFILFASRGDIEEMQMLVEQGADVNCSDYDGR